MSRFNPTPAEAGIVVPRVVKVTSAFYTMGDTGEYKGCYVSGLSKLCHKCGTNVHKRLNKKICLGIKSNVFKMLLWLILGLIFRLPKFYGTEWNNDMWTGKYVKGSGHDLF